MAILKPNDLLALAMDAPTLIAQARAGDVDAIAALISRSLQGYQVSVKADRHSYRLTLRLEAALPLSQAQIVTRIRQGMVRLQPEGIGTVLVQSYQNGQNQPRWSEEIALLGVEADHSVDSSDPPTVTTPAPQSVPSPASSLVPTRRPPAGRVSRMTARQRRQPLVIKASDFEPLRTTVILLVAIYGYFGCRHPGLNGPFMWLHFPDLAIHETGHLLFMPFGRFLHILGGSFTQIAFPAAFTIYFWISRQPFSAALTLFWTGQNFIDVAVYMRDAPYRLLPLTVDDPNAHDWYNLFRMTVGLDWAIPVANFTYSVGVLLYLVSIGLGLYVAWQTGRAVKAERQDG